MSRASKSRSPQANKLIARLFRNRLNFTPQTAAERIELVNAISHLSIDSAKLLETYHDTLCFLRAYPDSATLLRKVDQELFEFHTRVERYIKMSGDASAAKLADTGIASTTVTGSFSYDLTRYLNAEFEEQIDLDWESYETIETDPIWSMLPLLANWHEVDTFDNTQALTSRSWLAASQGKTDHSPLAALLSLLSNSLLPQHIQRHLFESAELPIRWSVGRSRGSRSIKRVYQPGRFWQKEPLRGRSSNLLQQLAKPAAQLVAVPLGQASRYTADIKDVLGVRLRELYSLTGSNPHEVYTVDPGRGIRFVIFGNQPSIRLPLETNFGAMIVRNGLPIGYGVSAMLFDRAEIAINIFPAFRAGESPFIIEQFFNLFYQHFGARVMIVRSYQVGDDNDEALESGSFWFYYKLGFRPMQPAVAALAKREAVKIASKRGYRSPLAILKRLAVSDMLLDTRTERKKFTELSLERVGLAVTRLIALRYDGDRQAAQSDCFNRMKQILGIRSTSGWTADQLLAGQSLAPLICLLPRIASWSDSDRRLLAQAVKAKGSQSERSFLIACQRHSRLEIALRALADATPAS